MLPRGKYGGNIRASSRRLEPLVGCRGASRGMIGTQALQLIT
jgi:hypothetical protein